MIRKTIGYLFLSLFLFSCSDLQDAAKNIKKVNENQDLIINKLNDTSVMNENHSHCDIFIPIEEMFF